VVGALPSALSFFARSMVFFSGIYFFRTSKQ
jgi:hypothetical protein